jgi:ABC-type oligopeptide transport system substrate-binding subunit
MDEKNVRVTEDLQVLLVDDTGRIFTLNEPGTIVSVSNPETATEYASVDVFASPMRYTGLTPVVYRQGEKSRLMTELEFVIEDGDVVTATVIPNFDWSKRETLSWDRVGTRIRLTLEETEESYARFEVRE